MTLKRKRAISAKTWSPPITHSEVQENKFRFVGGYFMTLKWRRTILAKTRSPPISHSEVQENKVPEPRAGSNSKARVHSNLKNPRLRPLQVKYLLRRSSWFIEWFLKNEVFRAWNQGKISAGSLEWINEENCQINVTKSHEESCNMNKI